MNSIKTFFLDRCQKCRDQPKFPNQSECARCLGFLEPNRCDSINETGTNKGKQCANAKFPGMKFCHLHGFDSIDITHDDMSDSEAELEEELKEEEEEFERRKRCLYKAK